MTDLSRINAHLARGGYIRVEGKGEAQRLVTMNRVTAAVRSIFVNDQKKVAAFLPGFIKRHSTLSALRQALLDADKNKVRAMLKDDHSLLKGTMEGGDTPLHYMARFGMHDLIAEFAEHLDAKALLRRSSKGESPLHAAIEGGNKEAINLLFGKLADLSPESLKTKETNGPGKKSLGHYIAESDDVELVDQAVKLGIPFNFTDVHGQYPLHIAVQTSTANFVHLIHLCHREAVREKDKDGKTPCDLAIETKHLDAAKELLRGNGTAAAIRKTSIKILQDSSDEDAKALLTNITNKVGAL